MVVLVVLDNTVLSNFGRVGQAGLVLSLWPETVCTTAAARGEYAAGIASALLPAGAWSGLPVAKLTAEEIRFASELSGRLGLGERSCLAVAFHRRGLFASDDRDARTAVHDLGIPVTGTLGILVLAVHQGQLGRQDANSLLQEMITLGYRSPVAALDSLP